MKASLKKLLHHHHNHHHNHHNHHHHHHNHHKHDRKDPKTQPLAKFDELTKASQDMQDMRDCYDSLLSAAAAATNSAYEFSESLREMGVCLLQKIGLSDNEETGKVMMLLGKVQFELQKLVDSYRAHICQTITVPSESLINEIHTLEEMKHQCDEKRELYEYMRTRFREKGKSKGGKEERFSSEQLQSAKDEFDEEATLFVFRLKSLKQGQSRSLLTQTTRHHAAQLSFFRKALKALEMVEPHVKLVAQHQHIDYQFSGLGDEPEDSEDDDDNGEETDSVSSASSVSSVGNDGELSFDYRRNDRQHNSIYATRNTTELVLDDTSPSVSRGYFAKENVKIGYEEPPFLQDRKMLSQSAPLFPQRKADPADMMRQLRPSASRKFHSYALPKPGESRISISTGYETPVSQDKPSPQRARNLYHSCPLEPKKFEKLERTENLSGSIIPNPNTVLKESNNNRMPPPLTERILLPQINPHTTSSIKKPKLLFFSGPITSKSLSTKPSFSARNPVIFKEPPQFSSGPILKGSIHHPSSPPRKGSPTASPTMSSSPRISELHELPRPPTNLIYNSGRPSGSIGFSAPLVSRSPEKSTTNKLSFTKIASPLPTPPLVAYSSIPLSSPRVAARSPPSGQSEPCHISDKSEVTSSPPLAQADQHPT